MRSTEEILVASYHGYLDCHRHLLQEQQIRVLVRISLVCELRMISVWLTTVSSQPMPFALALQVWYRLHPQMCPIKSGISPGSRSTDAGDESCDSASEQTRTRSCNVHSPDLSYLGSNPSAPSMWDPLGHFARDLTSLLGFLMNGAAMDGGVVRRPSMPSKKGCGLPPPNAAADGSRYAVTELDVYEMQDCPMSRC